jgi:hypothetical protein
MEHHTEAPATSYHPQSAPGGGGQMEHHTEAPTMSYHPQSAPGGGGQMEHHAEASAPSFHPQSQGAPQQHAAPSAPHPSAPQGKPAAGGGQADKKH